jgi:hypothetical protein
MGVFAGVAAGVVVTMASGELRADRDVAHELVTANEALVERLEVQEREIAELRDLVGATTKPVNNPGTTQPGTAPKTKAEVEMEEMLAFRKKVLAAIDGELDGIDERASSAKAAFDKHVEAYAKHRHEYEVNSNGWAKLDTILTPEGVEMLRPTYPNDWIAIRYDGKGGVIAKATTKPK